MSSKTISTTYALEICSHYAVSSWMPNSERRPRGPVCDATTSETVRVRSCSFSQQNTCVQTASLTLLAPGWVAIPNSRYTLERKVSALPNGVRVTLTKRNTTVVADRLVNTFELIRRD